MKYLLLLALAGCGKSDLNFRPGYTTERLEEIIARFEVDFDAITAFEVVFVSQFAKPMPENTIAACFRTGSLRRVEINPSLENSIKLDTVVYHELGHCSLGLRHYEVESDIMNSIIRYNVINNFEEYRLKMIENYAEGVY